MWGAIFFVIAIATVSSIFFYVAGGIGVQADDTKRDIDVENAKIKRGEAPEEWHESLKRDFRDDIKHMVQCLIIGTILQVIAIVLAATLLH